jgi:hypothetical protein
MFPFARPVSEVDMTTPTPAGGHHERVLRDDREERLQIKRNRPWRIRPISPSHEFQIPIHERITESCACKGAY